MKSTNKGFTLIELIIVIVILGILAVTASPKFLDLQGDATGATVEGVEGSLASAMKLVNAKALAQGKTGSDAQVTNPDVDVKYGYPDATVAAMQAILDISSEAATSGNPSTDWEIKVGTGDNDDEVKIFPAGAYDGSDTVAEKECYVLYTEADADNVATVESKIGGC